MPGMKIPTSTWNEIRDNYNNYPVIEPPHPFITPMLAFIDVIEELGYSSHLYPATSVGKLLIGKVKDFNRCDSMLEVDWSKNDQKYVVKYYQAELADPWEISFSETEMKERIVRLFTKRLRWFKEE